MSERRFDLAVVGAGPAGTAAALVAAQRGLAVALLDPLGEGADPPCGEGLLPAGVAALGALGIEVPAADRVSIHAMRYVVPGAPPLVLRLPRPALAIPRPRLRAALATAVGREPRIVRLFARASVERAAGGFVLEHAGARIRARALVLAHGTAGGAAVGAAVGLGAAGYASERFGLRARFEAARPLAEVEVHLAPACEVYLTPLPGGRVNAAFLFEHPPADARGPAELVRAALLAAPEAAARLGALVTPPAGRRLDPRRPRRVARDAAFLAGDAGAAIDPLLGCGLTVAFRTGACAGEAVAALAHGARSTAVERRYARELRREVRFRRALAGSLRFLARHPALLRGVSRAGRVRPELLEPLVRRAALGPA